MRLKSSRTKRFELSTPFLAARSSSRSLAWLFRTSYKSWSEDNGPRLAAALAYYALFSLAPLVMIAMAVAGAVLGERSGETALMAEFYGFVGPAGANALDSILQDLHRPGMSTLAGAAGSVLLLVGASAVFVELQDALNTIWHVQKSSGTLREIVVERSLGVGLVVLTEIVLILSVFFAIAEVTLGRIATYEWPGFGRPFHIVGLLASFATTVVLFGLIFKLLPKTSIEWKDVWPAAVLTASMFDVGKLIISLYLGKNSIVSAYGAASSVVVVVGWVYYSALILYFGAEFAKVYARAYGSRAQALPIVGKCGCESETGTTGLANFH